MKMAQGISLRLEAGYNMEESAVTDSYDDNKVRRTLERLGERSVAVTVDLKNLPDPSDERQRLWIKVDVEAGTIEIDHLDAGDEEGAPHPEPGE
jgi:hypothetical protein